jgi:lipopolysaccharide transport system permease protein
MALFTLVFGRLAKMPSDGFPYSVWVLAGLLPWTFFASAVTVAGNSLVGSAHLVSKVYFPRLIIPISSLGSAVVDLLVATGLLLGLVAWNGIAWGPNLLAAPLIFLVLVFTTLGIGTLLSALTVAYRDFTHLVPFLVQLWMYATPVVYPSSLVPERWRWILFLNPLAGICEGFRSAFLGQPFAIRPLAVSLAVSVALFVAGVAYFERVERDFADVI